MAMGPTVIPRIQTLVLIFIIMVQACVLWIGCARLSPTPDEFAHVAAGIDYWNTGNLDCYKVNPPLTKLWVSLPLVWAGQQVPLSSWDEDPLKRNDRPEFERGGLLAKQLGPQALPQLFLARRMGTLFSLLGTLGIFLMARQLIGGSAGLWAAVMWALNPIVLGYSCIIGSDIAAGSLGAWAIHTGLRANRKFSWQRGTVAGVCLGMAALTKFTWLVALPLWPLGALLLDVQRRSQAKNANGSRWSLRNAIFGRPVRNSVYVLLVAWLVICTGYRWQSVFQPLGAFRFVSQDLRGEGELRNRFRESQLAAMPVPLPATLLTGLDTQWRDFDQPRWNYLCGDWKRGGWWYYYLVAFAVKLPLCLLVLLAISLPACIYHRRVLIVCGGLTVVFFLLVSSKMNMNEHPRYLWLTLPMLITMACGLVRYPQRWWRWVTTVGAAGVILAGGVSFPWGISYSNVLCGGVWETHRYLDSSGCDWGQGWLRFRKLAQDLQAEGWRVAVMRPEYVTWDELGIELQSLNTTTQSRDTRAMVAIVIGTQRRQELQREGKWPVDQPVKDAVRCGCCLEVYFLPDHQSNLLPGLGWYSAR